MCKSVAEGGQRCATHLRPAYLKAIAPALQKPNLDLGEQVRLASSAVAYATTVSGIRGIEEDILKFALAGKHDVAEVLKFSLEEGEVQRHETQKLEAIILNTQSGQQFAVYLMGTATAMGLPLRTAYEQVMSIANEYVSNFLTESKSSDPAFNEYCRSFAEAFSHTAIETALDIYNQSASAEQISELLESRTEELGERISVSQADFDTAFKALAEESLPDLGKYQGPSSTTE